LETMDIRLMVSNAPMWVRLFASPPLRPHHHVVLAGVAVQNALEMSALFLQIVAGAAYLSEASEVEQRGIRKAVEAVRGSLAEEVAQQDVLSCLTWTWLCLNVLVEVEVERRNRRRHCLV
jgi:hypothetical protein